MKFLMTEKTETESIEEGVVAGSDQRVERKGDQGMKTKMNDVIVQGQNHVKVVMQLI